MQNFNKKEIKQSDITVCLRCGLPTTIIWVHGHGQCANCGTNIDECCRGEKCENGINGEDTKLDNGENG